MRRDERRLAVEPAVEAAMEPEESFDLANAGRVRLARRVLVAVVGLQLAVLAFLLLGGPALVARAWGFAGRLLGGLHEVGGLATIPLLACIATLVGAVTLLTLERFAVLTLSRPQRTCCDRSLVYAGRIAWMLGLLQTMLSLYAVRRVFGAQLDYEAMVAQLGDISGSAYGSSLIGGGTLLAGWIAQLLLTGRLRD